MLHLEEAHFSEDPRIRMGLGNAFGAHPPLLAPSGGAPLPRRQYAELETQPILAGGGSIWIQDVSFIEHGAGDLFGALEAHRAPPSPSVRRTSKTWSQLVRASVVLSRISLSSVSHRRRNDPAFG